MNLTGATFDRRQLLKYGGGGAAALGGAGLLAACGGGSSSSGSATSAKAPGGKPVKGGTLTVGLVTGGEVETLAVPQVVNTPDIARALALYDPLFKLTDQNEVVPWLAESAESSPDAKKWTFHLRKGVEWHDGSPFTSADVAYTIGTWQSEESYISPLAKQVIDFKGVRARDKYTIEVPLTKGVAEFPAITALFNAYIFKNGFTDFDAPIGTGPFVFDSFVVGKRSEFKANRNWWNDEGPYVDKLVIDSSFTDDTSRVNALLAGNIDVVPGMPASSASVNQNNSAVRLGTAEGAAFQALTAAVDRAPFNDPQVMEALKLIVDRPQMVESVFAGFATEGTDVPGRGLKYWAKDLKHEQDIEKAKSLLAKAGQQNLQIKLETSAAYPGYIEAATLFAQQAKEAGVTVNIEKIDPAVYYGEEYLQRPFSNNIWFTDPAITTWYLQAANKNAPYNESHWGDAQTDAVLFDAMAETDEAKAEEKWHAVQELQFTRGGYIIYGNYDFIDGYAPRVAGLETTPAGSCNQWSFEEGWLTS